MAEIFLSIDEAAELEGIGYMGLWQRMQRESDSYCTRTEKRTDGGKEKILVALSSLSKKARRAYKKKQEIGGEFVVADRIELEAPWYVDVDFNWYRKNYERQYSEALKMADIIRAYLEYDEGDRTTFAVEYAAEMEISTRTLYRYAESYLDAEAWRLKRLKETGFNYEYFKVLALCRKPKNANTFPSLSPEHRAYIENIWFHEDFAANHGTKEMLYTQFLRHFLELGMDAPSQQTVSRYINYLMNNKRMRNAYLLAQRGKLEYKRTVMMKGLRDTSQVPVLGIVQGDSHTFDFWVSYRDPDNGKLTAIRPTMVAWIDTRSRVVMGVTIAKTINSQVIKESMIKLVYEYGVPECILIDNGKDYTAKEMTGRKRNERNKLLVLDKDSVGFYKSLGIKDDYRALPYQPWAKGPVERFFGTVCEQFSKWFASYTGTLTGSKTEAKVRKDIKKLLEQGKLVSMADAYQLFDLWLQDTYHKRDHGGLKQIGEKYTKPMELFEKADERIRIAPPPKELAQTLLMKPGKALIRQTGIRKFGQTYMNPALGLYVEKKLDIRWNPADVSKLYVYDDDGRLICEAGCAELLQYQGLMTEKKLIEHMKHQKRQLAEDQRRLEEARKPYELRISQGDPLIAGRLDLMIEAKPSPKHVEEPNQEAENTKTDYFVEQGREALKRLRDLG